MTSAIPVQRSNQSYQANWGRVTCEFVIYPWMEKAWSEYMKFILFRSPNEWNFMFTSHNVICKCFVFVYFHSVLSYLKYSMS